MTFTALFFGLGLLSILVVYVSIYSTLATSGPLIFPVKYLRWSISIIVIFIVGCLVGTAWSRFQGQGFREFFFALALPLREKSFYPLIGVAVLIFLAAIAMSAVYSVPNTQINPQPPFTLVTRFIYAVNHNPLGIFALFTGFATLLALALTLQSIWEIRRSITSFPDLMDRLCEMLDGASSTNRVRMVCYTPALGALALPEYDYARFFDKLTAPSNQKSRAEIICLGPSELSDWHDRFVGRWTLRGKVDLSMAQAATASAMDIVTKLGGDAVKLLPFQFMPGCYFFFTRSQAIVVAPLFLQYPQGAPKMTRQSAPPVDMIGFETSDKGIINTLEQMYKRYKELPSTLIGEVTTIVDTQLFEDANIDQTIVTICTMLGRVDKHFNAAKQREYKSILGQEDVKLEMVLRLLLKDS